MKSPAKRYARICGRASWAPFTTGSYGPPDQSVSSFSWMRSRSMPPKTMAPRRPLPTGRA